MFNNKLTYLLCSLFIIFSITDIEAKKKKKKKKSKSEKKLKMCKTELKQYKAEYGELKKDTSFCDKCKVRVFYNDGKSDCFEPGDYTAGIMGNVTKTVDGKKIDFQPAPFKNDVISKFQVCPGYEVIAYEGQYHNMEKVFEGQHVQQFKYEGTGNEVSHTKTIGSEGKPGKTSGNFGITSIRVIKVD